MRYWCVIPVGNSEVERSFSCVRKIDNWLCNSTLTNLLRDLANTAVHGRTILVLKPDIFSAYIYIHPGRIMTSSLFIDI